LRKDMCYFFIFILVKNPINRPLTCWDSKNISQDFELLQNYRYLQHICENPSPSKPMVSSIPIRKDTVSITPETVENPKINILGLVSS
jgi:hypothetical protein